MLGDDGIFVTKIIPGGSAEKEGTLEVGDRIIKVSSIALYTVHWLIVYYELLEYAPLVSSFDTPAVLCGVYVYIVCCLATRI